MQKYKVSVHEEQGGYLWIEAECKAEAIALAEDIMDDLGFDQEKYPIQITHRETGVYTIDTEELTNKIICIQK